jgi:chemotaxis protein histidine kinase CheA
MHGIDWDRLAAKAAQFDLAHHTHADLVRALFHPGVSTVQSVTERSGRGVGLSAVAKECAALGGVIAVESHHGQGTRFRFSLPLPTFGQQSLPPSRLSTSPISPTSMRSPRSSVEL